MQKTTDLPPRRKRQPRTLNYLSCTFCRKAKVKCIPNTQTWPQGKCRRCTQKDFPCSAPQRKKPHADAPTDPTPREALLSVLLDPYAIRPNVDTLTTHDALVLLSVHALLQMAVDEMYHIGERYLAPIQHDTVWSLHTEDLKDKLWYLKGPMAWLQKCIEALQGPVAQNIITAKFDLDHSFRTMDDNDLFDKDERIDHYGEHGHHGIAYVLQMHRIITNPELASAESSRLIDCRRLFLAEWVSTFNQVEFAEYFWFERLKKRGVDITESQLFVPNALCQLPAVLEDVRRDGRKDFLGRSTYAIQHDAGFRMSWPDAALAEKDIMGRSAAHMACCTKDSALLKQLLEVPLEVWNTNSTFDMFELPPLHFAAIRGYAEAFEMVRQKTSLDFLRTKLDEKSRITGRTCLHWAASCGHLDTVGFMCQNMTAAKVRRTYDKMNQSALHLAARYGRFDVVKVLCQYMETAAVEFFDIFGRSPFWYAAESNHVAILSILEPLSDADGKDDDGYTPLAAACAKGHTEVLRYLLTDCHNSININAVNEDDETPLDLALKGAHSECGALLMAHGALKGEALRSIEGH